MSDIVKESYDEAINKNSEELEKESTEAVDSIFKTISDFFKNLISKFFAKKKKDEKKKDETTK